MLSTKSEWLQMLPYAGMLSMLVYITYQAYKKPKGCRINEKVEKDSAKVVSMVDIEDVADKTAYCRCWKSNKFPLCDGSHNKHNTDNSDNIGPLVLKKKA